MLDLEHKASHLQHKLEFKPTLSEIKALHLLSFPENKTKSSHGILKIPLNLLLVIRNYQNNFKKESRTFKPKWSAHAEDFILEGGEQG